MKAFRGQPEHDYWRTGSALRFRLYGWCGVALLLLLVAAHDWRNPQAPPFSGRHAPVHSLMFERFGPNGMPALFCLLAGAAAIAAFRAWRALNASDQTSTAKKDAR